CAVTPLSRSPRREWKNRLDRGALASTLPDARRGTTGRNISLHCGFSRSKPPRGKQKLIGTLTTCYENGRGADWRVLRQRSNAQSGAVRLKLTTVPPAIYCPALYFGEWMGRWFRRVALMRPDCSSHSLEKLMEIGHASESRTQKN